MKTEVISPRAAVRKDAARSNVDRNRRLVLAAAEVGVPFALLALWWVLSSGSTNAFFPPLQVILGNLSLLFMDPNFLLDIVSSLGNLLVSFGLACVLGVSLGLSLGLSRRLSWIVEPTLHFLRAIPPVALLPIFVSIIGFGAGTRVLSITIASLFPIAIATIDGVRGVDPTLRMVIRAYQLPRWQSVRDVILPAASPRIMAGMQVGLLVAFIVMIASEMLGSSQGLGAATLLAQQSFAIGDMWAGILVLGIFGYVLSGVFGLVRRRVLRWYIASQKIGKES